MSEFEYPPKLGWCTKHNSTTVCDKCEIDRLTAELAEAKFNKDEMDNRNCELVADLEEARTALRKYEGAVEVEGAFEEVRELCMKICNSPPETPIKGDIESMAYLLGHHPLIINNQPVTVWVKRRTK